MKALLLFLFVLPFTLQAAPIESECYSWEPVVEKKKVVMKKKRTKRIIRKTAQTKPKPKLVSPKIVRTPIECPSRDPIVELDIFPRKTPVLVSLPPEAPMFAQLIPQPGSTPERFILPPPSTPSRVPIPGTLALLGLGVLLCQSKTKPCLSSSISASGTPNVTTKL